LFNYDIYDSNNGVKIKSVTKVNLNTGAFLVNNTNVIETYPNPASDILYVELSNSEFNNYKLSVIDINGKMIMCDFKHEGKTLKINIKNIPCGLYNLRIQIGNEYKMKNFIKK